jgi:hypothetical protein
MIEKRTAGDENGFLDRWHDRWFAAWNRHDPEAILGFCAEDIVISDPALPAPAKGHAAMRSFAEDSFATFPDLRLEALEPPCPSRLGGGAWLPYRFIGTMQGPWPALDTAPTGALVDFRAVSRWTFRDELLCGWETIYDNLAAARQMGIVPAQGTRSDRLFTRLQHLRARGQRRANARRDLAAGEGRR